MNILYIHQYFITPNDPGGTRSYWLAREFVKKGHNVTMLTSSSKFEEKIKILRYTVNPKKIERNFCVVDG